MIGNGSKRKVPDGDVSSTTRHKKGLGYARRRVSMFDVSRIQPPSVDDPLPTTYRIVPQTVRQKFDQELTRNAVVHEAQKHEVTSLLAYTDSSMDNKQIFARGHPMFEACKMSEEEDIHAIAVVTAQSWLGNFYTTGKYDDKERDIDGVDYFEPIGNFDIYNVLFQNGDVCQITCGDCGEVLYG